MNVDIVESVFAAVSAGDYERLREFMVDDLAFELPYGPSFMPKRFDGLELWDQMQRSTFAMFESFVETLDTAYPVEDPDTLICEYRSRAVIKATNKEYANSYVGIFRFRDGKIAFWREYHNPVAVAEALGG
jgi:ketosteroid isomerase-like protein